MFDTRTVQLMAETFGSEKCQKCGQPAERYHSRAFYCRRCFDKQPQQTVEIRTYKLHVDRDEARRIAK